MRNQVVLRGAATLVVRTDTFWIPFSLSHILLLLFCCCADQPSNECRYKSHSKSKSRPHDISFCPASSVIYQSGFCAAGLALVFDWRACASGTPPDHYGRFNEL